MDNYNILDLGIVKIKETEYKIIRGFKFEMEHFDNLNIKWIISCFIPKELKRK